MMLPALQNLIKPIALLCLLLAGEPSSAQKAYGTAQAHAHNDYEQALPFWDAYKHRFGSVEADVFLQDEQLLVAHELKNVSKFKRLESMYLMPIDSMIKAKKGFVYGDSSQRLQLMIDIKTEAEPALRQLVLLLQQYPAIINSKSVQIAISGNRPLPQNFNQYPPYIYFDAVPNIEYPAAAWSRIVMVSDNFRKYSTWSGTGKLPDEDRTRLQQVVDEAHAMGKKVRFWNAPDGADAWCVLMSLRVDYINTDRIKEISSFLTEETSCK